ncbi:hypothetical protein, partial [Frateuria sp. STR12]|uniref:hypothetical protein n=1 Tax=Frateuria hangzhouensis TaxID=2995589 RepID=UPI002260B458
FRLTQEADDLLFGKTLLHVQSPSNGGLDSKPMCYSKAGGRRHHTSDVGALTSRIKSSNAQAPCGG